MKQEVYSCLKMLESLHTKGINVQNIGAWSSAEALGDQYRQIGGLLKKYLSKEQLEFIPYVPVRALYGRESEKSYIIETVTSCAMAISYLNSLEMDLNKELLIKKEELKLKEKELEYREKEVEYMKKLLDKSLEAIKQFPELQRSKIVEDIKKTHRGIEEHSKNEIPKSK